MLVSMTPNDEVKTIHASLNDGKLRKWEFEPYTEQGKIELTDQDYATIQRIKGNTVKFNQLVQNGNFADTSGWGYSNATQSASNNVLTITKTANNGYGAYREFHFSVNHKIYRRLDFKGASSVNYRFNGFFPNTDGTGDWKTISQLGIITSSTTYFNSSNNEQSDFQSYQLRNFICCDLTDIFGSGNEPVTVEEFETWLSNNIGLLPYYDYTLGSLISFKGTGLKTVGFNQWDEEWEVGGISSTSGANNNSITNRIRSKNYIPVLSNVTYYFKNGGSGDLYIFLYGSDKNYLNVYLNKTNTTYFITSAVSYIRICPTSDYGTTYNNDICINISDTSKNGTYEPYTESTLSLEALNTLFPTGMKDVPDYANGGTVYDEYSSSREDTRIGAVDLGTLNWVASASVVSGHYDMRSNGIQDLIKVPSSNDIKVNAICTKYEVLSRNSEYSENIGISISSPSGALFIYDADYNTQTSVEAFKQAMSGVIFYYELKNPTSQDISIDLTYPIWNGGTEQILPENSSTPTTTSMKATIEYPDRTEDVDFLYKQTTFESAIPQFSLVCKNQELPMTLEDNKLICECDSSITNESGFFDCKVKMQDLNSVAYSQKIQLHVERGIND